jgi:hypothetical protein
MKKSVLLIAIVMLSLSMQGQITTTFYKKGTAPAIHPEIKLKQANMPIKSMPSFDVKELLKEDSLHKGLDVPFRFGKGFNVDYSLKDGKWTKTNDGRIWNLQIHSKGAYSINLIFDELYLPEGGELYLYNQNRSVVYGPITSSQNTPPMRIS